MVARVFDEENTMHALRDFFTTDYGLLSAAVIAFTLGMGVFFTRYMARHIREDTERVEHDIAARGAMRSCAWRAGCAPPGGGRCGWPVWAGGQPPRLRWRTASRRASTSSAATWVRIHGPAVFPAPSLRRRPGRSRR